MQEDGSVRCWGYNGWGNLGYGGSVDLDGKAVAVSVGYYHSCAVLVRFVEDLVGGSAVRLRGVMGQIGH